MSGGVDVYLVWHGVPENTIAVANADNLQGGLDAAEDEVVVEQQEDERVYPGWGVQDHKDSQTPPHQRDG
jgi:hypothetical protein